MSKLNISLSSKAKSLKIGIYQHYKGKQYQVLGVALHSETFEELVVYQALYGKQLIWVRPLEMFLEDVQVNGRKQKRFTFIKS